MITPLNEEPPPLLVIEATLYFRHDWALFRDIDNIVFLSFSMAYVFRLIDTPLHYCLYILPFHIDSHFSQIEITGISWLLAF